MQDDPQRDQEAALAEFAALRAEILARQGHQHTLLALQLSISGAVFSFALSGPNRSAVLLVVPFSSYLLAGRFIAHHHGTLSIGRYIRQHLNGRVTGGLGWEEWLRSQQPRVRLFRGADPLFVGFPGVALAALAGVLPLLLGLPASPTTGLLWLGWTVGAVLSVVAGLLIFRTRRHFILRDWGRDADRDS